jgi:ketosteroid isomerase-like protein
MNNTDTVRAMMTAYLTQDRPAAEHLLGPDLRFTSPQDDHIDRTTYFERCFPTVARLRTQDVLKVVDAGDDQVYLLYQYELQDGSRYRNTELLTITEGQIREIQVFFGGAV